MEIIQKWPKKQVWFSVVFLKKKSIELYKSMSFFFNWPLLLSVLGEKALADTGVPYSAIEQACVGYVYGTHFHSFIAYCD